MFVKTVIHDALQKFGEKRNNGDGSIATDITRTSTFKSGVTAAIFRAPEKAPFL